MFTEISKEELRDRMEAGEDFDLVDVRSGENYRRRHLPGALHIPLAEMDDMARVVLKIDGEVVLYCSGPQCSKGRRAARILEGMGFRNVFVYAGGILDWKAGRLPFEGDGEG